MTDAGPQAAMSVDAPLGRFEEQVMLAVIRTGSHAYGMAVRRVFVITDRGASARAASRTMRERLRRGVDLARLLGTGAD